MEQILYFLVLGALFYFMMRGCCGPGMTGHGKGHKHETKGIIPSPPSPLPLGEGGRRPGEGGFGPFDPVCGMDVSDRTPLTSQYGGKTYYFCSAVCKSAFEKEPHKYLSGKGKQEEQGGCC